MKNLEGKIVVVTGAGSGIGRALALQLAAQGAQLALCDVNDTNLQKTVDIAAAHGVKVYSATVDVSKRDAVQTFADNVARALGNASVIINNAGVALSQNVEAMNRQDFEWVLNINFWGVVNGCEAFLPQLRQQKDAHIVNISSIFGIIGVPSQSAYNASKFAVKGFTEALRQELTGSNIHVTCVHPGGIKTNIARNARVHNDMFGRAADVKKLADDFDRLAATTAEEAARQIVRAIERNQKRLLIGTDAKVLDTVQRLLPNHYDTVLGMGYKLLSKFAKR
ncbi:MAG: SDR family oxidoreductase [Moraxellaceae bacterium]|nr:SDR family oxidoreductase [Moraxellaceae bacterium]MCP5176380.1 SDR family oxidoreductase [Moraxellaceae bacterium]